MAMTRTRSLLATAVAVADLGAAFLAWQYVKGKGGDAGFLSRNGRIEVTEYDVAAKRAGRLITVVVSEGEMV